MDIRTTRIIVSPAPGNLFAGTTITLEVDANAPLIVTPGPDGAEPELTLSDGAVASFSSVDAAGHLIFTASVGAADVSPDLLVTGLALNGATIAGQGTAGFTTVVSSSLGVVPVAVTAADLWSTGTIDLVTANADGSLSVLTGDGQGGFVAAQSYQTGNLRAVLAVDLAGTGTPDLVAIGGTQVIALTAHGDGTFDGPVTLYDNPSPITAIVAAGQDLIVTDSSGFVTVLAPVGDGTYSASQSLLAGGSPAGIAAGDFEGTGALDLAVTNSADVTVSIFTNDGGTLHPGATLVAGRDPTGIIAGDFRGHGVIDLAVADSADTSITVFLGNGDGTFAPGVTYAAEGGVADLRAVDLNGTGTLDLVAGNRADGTVSVLLGVGDGTFQTQAIFANGSPLAALTTAATTASGAIDVITADGGARSVTTLRNTGSIGPDPSVQGPILDSSGLALLAGADTGLAINPAHLNTLLTVASVDPGTSGTIALGPLAIDAAGHFFAVAGGNQANPGGGIVQWQPGGTVLTEPYGFSWTADFQTQVGGLTLGPDGSLYGVTPAGSDGSGGAIYQITSTGGENVLASFASGTTPAGAVALDATGNVFGTTQTGGTGAGTLFEYVTASQTLLDLADFDGAGLGGGPTSGVIRDAQGNLFGTTQSGGDNGQGTVFEYSAATQTLATLASFAFGTTGYLPSGPLVEDAAGNLYGATQGGGASYNGTIFEYQASTGTLLTLHAFTGGNDGAAPSGGLLLDSQGNLFGTTAFGGRNGFGTVFELAADHHTLITLDSLLGGVAGGNPVTGVVADAAGNLFTAAGTGGANGSGALIEVQDSSFGATVICFYPGTRIATPHGPRAVETLAIGDPVTTADGGTEPVRWIGRQTVSTRFADPLRVLPVRIRQGALGRGLPVRDLLISADHAVAIDTILVHAGALVNGTSITRETTVPETFTYYHIELASHDLILAEGQAVETFIDNVDRWAFDNWAEHEALYGHLPEMAELDRPRAHSRRQVPQAIRTRIDALAAPGRLAA